MAVSIEKLRKVKEKIRLAIISKGVEVSEDASLAGMVAKIEEIRVSKNNKKKEKK
jgi:ribosomal protein L30/L7E